MVLKNKNKAIMFKLKARNIIKFKQNRGISKKQITNWKSKIKHD